MECSQHIPVTPRHVYVQSIQGWEQYVEYANNVRTFIVYITCVTSPDDLHFLCEYNVDSSFPIISCFKPTIFKELNGSVLKIYEAQQQIYTNYII
jgi:hypothetical protein